MSEAENNVKSTVDTVLVSDHQPEVEKSTTMVLNGTEPGWQPVDKDAAKGRKRTRRAAAKVERQRQQAAAVNAVQAATHLRAGEPPLKSQLERADPEVLARELRIALGIDRLPLTVSEIERGKRDPSLPVPIGRPTEYSDQEAELICEWISNGNSLNAYCVRTGRHPSTIYRWISQQPPFRDRFARAFEDRADTLVDEMLAIADGVDEQPTLEQVKRAELQISTRKWCAERMRPTKWGVQQPIGPQQPITFNIGIVRGQPAPVTYEQSTTGEPLLQPVRITSDTTG